MKTLIKMLTIFLPLLVFSQDTLKVSPEAKQVATEIIKNKKSIDSMKHLKEIEVKKQIKLLTLIKQKIEELKQQNKLNPAKDYIIKKNIGDTAALKPNSDAIFWEEIPRRWTGRIFNKSDTKIRIFRFTETGDKIYLN